MNKSTYLTWNLPLNTTDISQDLLNIDNKNRSNLLAWKGQFSPQFVQALMNKYATEGSKVLDPFVGSGTVLYEAAIKNLEAFGAEINPSAYILSRTYKLINLNISKRQHCIEQLDNYLNSLAFTINIKLIEKIFKYYRNMDNPAIKIMLESLVVLLDTSIEIEYEKLIVTWKKLKKVLLCLPYSAKSINTINCDARNLQLPDDYFDIVITSPPYINVFNYHQQYRKSVELLNWDVLSIAKSEIGSNRKNRSNRFLTVIQYCLDLAQVFMELKRVCKPSGHVIFVVGRESKIRKTKFYNGRLLSHLVQESVGFNLFKRQERVFTNRFGTKIYEDILHFNLPTEVSENSLQRARLVAKEVLEEALKNTFTEDVTEDIKSAINNINNVNPSPIFKKCKEECITYVQSNTSFRQAGCIIS